MLIRISGRATVTRDNGQPLTATALRELDGATSADTCVNYIYEESLADLGLTGGAVKLVRDPDGTGFRVVTEYGAPTKLKPAVLKKLAEETTAQWSDGIGESCFDVLADHLGVTINLAPIDEAAGLRVEQIDDGKKVPKLPRSKTALAKAAAAGDLDGTRKLLDAGADPDAPYQGYTPLLQAIGNGHADVALELIARGADIRIEDIGGSDPLMSTALCHRMTDEGAARVARALLERGADPHRRRGKPAYGGAFTPLYMADNRKKTALLAVLREYGAVE